MSNENKIRILYVQPGKYPEERVIEHTLAAMQTLVGGDIEAVYPWKDTQDQRDILHQLLSEEMRPSLLALCGEIAIADGTLCWPLPGHTYISCHFGEVDAFGNAGHRGTDIPTPEGTPILAAHSGTVLVSGWNDSYGNHLYFEGMQNSVRMNPLQLVVVPQ